MSIGNCLTSFFAGFVIFSLLGFLAHELNTSVDKVAESGMSSRPMTHAYIFRDNLSFHLLQYLYFQQIMIAQTSSVAANYIVGLKSLRPMYSAVDYTYAYIFIHMLSINSILVLCKP